MLDLTHYTPFHIQHDKAYRQFYIFLDLREQKRVNQKNSWFARLNIQLKNVQLVLINEKSLVTGKMFLINLWTFLVNVQNIVVSVKYLWVEIKKVKKEK